MSEDTNKVTLGFTGDISFSGFFKNAYKKDDLISPQILDFFNGNTATIINQESPITKCRITKKSRLAHRSDVEIIPYIQNTIPNPVFSLANNHMLDYGRIGIIDTIENLIKENCTFIGAGRNFAEATKYIVVGNDDIKIGVIAIEYKRPQPAGKNWAEPFFEGNINTLANRIQKMKTKENVDWTVVVYHGGEEFLYAPLPFNRNLMHKFVDLGADVIVAHHPHVVQGYEYYKGVPIFYSLGNFIFDTTYQRAQEGTDNGMILKLNFTKDKVDFENLPIKINREDVKIEVGEENPYFVNYADINYNAMWTYQCVRKKEALDKAKELRLAEKQAIKDYIASEKERVSKIIAKYEARQIEAEEEAEETLDLGLDDELRENNQSVDEEVQELNVEENQENEVLIEEDGSGESLAAESDTGDSRKNISLKKRISKNIKNGKKGIRKFSKSLKNKKKRTYTRGRILYKLFYKNVSIPGKE